jgi:hypothetical protein
MLVGWLIAAASMLGLLMGSNLTLSQDEDGNTIAPPDAPSIPFLSLQMLLFGTGFWMADVMGDSLVAEKAKLEPLEARGSLQSSCYSYRFFGLMVAAPFSATIYAWVGPFYVIFVLSVMPLTILPLIYMMGEVKNAPVAATRDQCNEIWKTVCSRAVWQPLGFVYLYNVLQVGNAAWKEFLRTSLGFTSSMLNSLLIVSYVLLYVGVLTYKYYLINWSWRAVYITTTTLSGIFSLLRVLLVMGITFGLSNFWFALGDDVFSEFVAGIQFLPTTIMMVNLCPVGSEGASYAMFTTVNNSAMHLHTTISTHLLGIWDVSKKALQEGDLSGMIKLTLLTTAFQFSGIFFVGMLPKTKEELFSLKDQSFGSSRVGGLIFLSVTFLSILYASVVAFLNTVKPGWMGES